MEIVTLVKIGMGLLSIAFFIGAYQALLDSNTQKKKKIVRQAPVEHQH